MDRWQLRSFVCMGLLAGAGWLAAQQQKPMLCHTMETTGAIDDPAKLAPPEKMTGIGNGAIAITVANDEAKLWFTQRLNLLHDFWDYESRRAFEQSVRSDPKCAMCYWGLYQAASFRGGTPPWAAEALKKADKLKKHATKAEQLYIKAAVTADKEQAARSRHGPNTGGGKGKEAVYADSKETKILRTLVALQPDDVQARTDRRHGRRAGQVHGADRAVAGRLDLVHGRSRECR